MRNSLVFVVALVAVLLLVPDGADARGLGRKKKKCMKSFKSCEGNFTSINYPENYPMNSSCTFKIKCKGMFVFSCPNFNLPEATAKKNVTSCRGDYMKLNGMKFCGTQGPAFVMADKKLTAAFKVKGTKDKDRGNRRATGTGRGSSEGELRGPKGMKRILSRRTNRKMGSKRSSEGKNGKQMDEDDDEDEDEEEEEDEDEEEETPVLNFMCMWAPAQEDILPAE